MVTASSVSAVGTLGLTVAGGYFFGPVGAAAGAVLGSFLFGASGPDIEGPRLGDTSVSASTYGNVIPVAFGVQKLAGAMIWATDIIEDKNTRTEGDGIFGGGQKITEYRYYADVAVAFAEGPCTGLLRLWAGEKLLADLQAPDLTPGGTDSLADAMRYFVRGKRYRFRFYRGTADQEPDPLIRRNIDNEVGANATPAFRDLIYLVFERLPLDEFGNRIPPITAEIAWTSIAERPERALGFMPTPPNIFNGTSYQRTGLAVDWQRHYAYVQSLAGGGKPGGIRRFNLRTGREDLQVPFGTAMEPEGNVVEPTAVDLNGYVYAGNSGDIVKLSPDGLTFVAKVDGVMFGFSQLDVAHAFTLAEPVPMLFAATTLGGIRIIRGDHVGQTMTLVYSDGVPEDRVGGVVGGREGLGECEGWCSSRNFPSAGSTITLRRMIVNAGATLNAGIQVIDYTFTPANFDTDISLGTNLAYDEEDDGVIFVVIVDGAYKLVKYSVADGVVWTRDWSSLYEVPRAARVIDGELTFWRAGSLNPTLRKIDARTGETIYELDDWGAGGELTWTDPLTGQMLNMTFSGIFQAFPDRIARDGVPLSTVVTALCARVGLEAGDIDVAQLTDQVRGFSLARQVSIRGGLELLAVAYNFDCVDRDGQLKFTKRGSSPIRVITQDELAYVSDPGSQAPELFLETRAQDVDLPARFTVRYHDIERDADIGVQTVKRIVRPAATMQSQNEATLDLPLVLSAEEQIALRQGFSPWIERVHHQWHVPWAHLDIDPGDVVTIALEDGRAFEVRVLKVDIGANLELAWDTVVQESSSYDVSALTSSGLTYRRAIAAPTPATRLLLADSPLLADGDDTARRSSGLYWAMGGIGQPGWTGGVVFESRDAAGFVMIDESTAEAAWGFCQAALGATATPFGTDRTNTLTVSMTAGGDRLGTVSELEMLNGANRALLIDPDGTVEVIAFANVTANDFGSYQLDTLLRGLRGNEGCVGDHVTGALFLLLEEDTLHRLLLPLDELDAVRYYRAVGRGGQLSDAPTFSITPIGRDLMPYAPVHLKSNGNAWGTNITLSWVRQTRLGGEWVDSFAGTVLAEDDEAYELEILDGPGGAVLRTATGITAASFVYTTAMQSADFGNPQTALTFRVYQISAQVGRGFASEDTTVDAR